MYRYDDCLIETCVFVGAFIIGIVPDIGVAYEGLLFVFYIVNTCFVWCLCFVLLY